MLRIAFVLMATLSVAACDQAGYSPQSGPADAYSDY